MKDGKKENEVKVKFSLFLGGVRNIGIILIQVRGLNIGSALLTRKLLHRVLNIAP